MNPVWKRNYLKYKAFLLDTVAKYRKRADTRVYLEILLSLATISIFSIFALKPTLLTITVLVKEIDSNKSTLARMDEKLKEINQAKELYDAKIKRIELLKSAIPNKPNPDLFLRQIEGLSGKLAVNVESLSMGSVVILGNQEDNNQSKTSPKKDRLSFILNLNSDYASLVSFLSEAENMRRPVVIDSLNLKSQADEAGTITLGIQGSAPYLREKKSLIITEEANP